jgi:hypothetical protein
LPPEGPVDPLCDLGIAINDDAGDAADEPSIDGDRTGGRLWQRPDLRHVDIERGAVIGILAVKAAIRTDSGSRIRSNKASRSESSIGRSATSATSTLQPWSSDDQRGEHTSIIGQIGEDSTSACREWAAVHPGQL